MAGSVSTAGQDDVAGVGTARPDNGSFPSARGRERWVVNKLRALNAWYSKGYEGGSHFRTAINHAESVAHVRGLIDDFFFSRR